MAQDLVGGYYIKANSLGNELGVAVATCIFALHMLQEGSQLVHLSNKSTTMVGKD